MRSCVLFAGAIALLPGLAAAADGNQVLAQVDAAMTRATDQSFEYEAITKEAGKPERSMAFDVFIKGKEWRRIDFLAPGDVKGMRILVRSVSNLYVYLPAYKKVRRVASHVKEQGFMGTSFSHDEMSLVTFSPVYTAKLLEEADKFWKLEATIKPDAVFPYPRLLMEVRKDIQQPVQIDYFNDKGLHVKTETRLKYSCQDKICTPGIIKMVDHTRGDMESSLNMRKWQPNSGLDDDFFTVRALQRSR
jgi:outer membrane lipoprotein-sorting protein